MQNLQDDTYSPHSTKHYKTIRGVLTLDEYSLSNSYQLLHPSGLFQRLFLHSTSQVHPSSRRVRPRLRPCRALGRAAADAALGRARRHGAGVRGVDWVGVHGVHDAGVGAEAREGAP